MHPSGLTRYGSIVASCDRKPIFAAIAFGAFVIEPEGYQNDDPSRSDCVVLTDEPADEIPAPDLGDLIDRCDRGRILRDR
jgi:hypothetical protein